MDSGLAAARRPGMTGHAILRLADYSQRRQYDDAVAITPKLFAALAAAVLAVAAHPAAAQDKVKVGVFPICSSLPYFVAVDLGYFKELNIEPEMTTLMGGPPNVAALITNQIEVSAVLVTLEGLNADRQETRRRDVHRHAQPEHHLQDGAVRRARGACRQGQDTGGLQGAEADVGAGAGESQHRQGHPRQRRV